MSLERLYRESISCVFLPVCFLLGAICGAFPAWGFAPSEDLCRSVLVSVLTGSRFSWALSALRFPALLFLLSLLPGRRFLIPAVVMFEGMLCGFSCTLIPVRSAVSTLVLSAMLFQSILGSLYYAGAALIREEGSDPCFLLLSLAYFAVCLLDGCLFRRRLAMLLAFSG